MINELIKEELRKIFDGRKLTEPISYYYRKIATKLNVHPERVRKHHRMLKDKDKRQYHLTPDECFKKVNESGIESTIVVDFEPKSHEELAELHKIDLTKYKISTYWSKLRPNGKFSSSVLAKSITSDTDLSLQKQVLLDELFDKAPKYIPYSKKLGSKNKELLLEIAIFDHHFGKMAHSEEAGEDYDLKIAGKKFSNAIEELISNVDFSKVEKILFPIGNDMFNVDNMNSTTTGGTPQDTDTRFHKMVRFVKNILIQEINNLSLLAPVDVIVVPGNHDEQTSFLLGEILDAYYHNNKNVFVDNSPKLRKYYGFGKNSILFTHGDKEKHANLGMIFAAEQPKLWSETKYRFIQLGHFHHNKKINYLSTDEYQGFQIQILPSLSPNDKWHYGKGFLSLKQAKAFLYNKEKGLIAEFTHSN